MPSITITVTAAEAARVSAVATAGGFPADGKAWIIALAKQALQAYEQSQNQTSYVQTYTPISPT